MPNPLNMKTEHAADKTDFNRAAEVITEGIAKVHAADKAQEWTAEYVEGLFNAQQYSADAFRVIADDHNAALAGKQEFWDACEVGYEAEIKQLREQLAAERETAYNKGRADSGKMYDLAMRDNRKLGEELAAAQAAIAEVVKGLRDTDADCFKRTINALQDVLLGDTTALDAAIAEARKPLMDALKRMPEVAYEAIINGAGVSIENLPNELQCICDAEE